jgi:hypothetical protein
VQARTLRVDRELPVRQLGARSGLLWSRDGLTLAGIGRLTELPIDRPGGHAAAAAGDLQPHSFIRLRDDLLKTR